MVHFWFSPFSFCVSSSIIIINFFFSKGFLGCVFYLLTFSFNWRISSGLMFFVHSVLIKLFDNLVILGASKHVLYEQ